MLSNFFFLLRSAPMGHPNNQNKTILPCSKEGGCAGTEHAQEQVLASRSVWYRGTEHWTRFPVLPNAQASRSSHNTQTWSTTGSWMGGNSLCTALWNINTWLGSQHRTQRHLPDVQQTLKPNFETVQQVVGTTSNRLALVESAWL